MKKIILLIIIIAVIVGGYFGYKHFFGKNEIPVLETETEKVNVSKYYIYGTNLNIEGTLKIGDSNFEEIYLTLYNGEFKDFEIKYKDDGNLLTFNLAEELNKGLYLEDIARGDYYMFIKAIYENKENPEEKIEKYYVLENKTEYLETEYYTFTSVNNKITINSDNDYKTMMLNVKEKKDSKEVADIVLDPGHGGMDGGAEAFDYSERDFTYPLAEIVKEKLEKEGYKIELTRGELSQNDVMEEYNEGGRAVVSSELYSKYLLSLHFNSNDSTSVNGLEIYSPANIDYTFAKSLAENITSMTGMEYSKQKTYKLFNGVYSHNFSETEIQNSLAGYEEKGYEPYNITTDSNYYYMIRETGGIVTGAYVDDSNPEKVGVNPYYKSNRGTESYVLELGYITNSADFDIIKNKQEDIADAIVKSIKENL